MGPCCEYNTGVMRELVRHASTYMQSEGGLVDVDFIVYLEGGEYLVETHVGGVRGEVWTFATERKAFAYVMRMMEMMGCG